MAPPAESATRSSSSPSPAARVVGAASAANQAYLRLLGAKEHGRHFSNGYTCHALATIGELTETGRFWLPGGKTFPLAAAARRTGSVSTATSVAAWSSWLANGRARPRHHHGLGGPAC